MKELRHVYDDEFTCEKKKNQKNEITADDEADIEFEINDELIQFYEESIRYKKEKSWYYFNY
jgi:hypothetical protein